MADFMIRFLICNLFICALVGILLAARHLLRNILSGRMQYHLWFLLLGLLTVPAASPDRFPNAGGRRHYTRIIPCFPLFLKSCH